MNDLTMACFACNAGLVLLGLFTRLAVIPLLVIMAVALATTKWPLARGSRLLVHGARGTNRLVDDSRHAIPPFRWCRTVVGRRMACGSSVMLR
jgi:hypothetical protein